MKTEATTHRIYRRAELPSLLFSKIITLTFILFVLFPRISFGQKNRGGFDSSLAPVRGNYKVFESLSPQPKATNLDVDKLRFPFDQSWADKMLAIKPVYLQNVSVDDFKLPDPPANSSDQERAELNYLLYLQHNRTAEDISSSIYMSDHLDTPPSEVGQAIGYWTEPQKLPLTDSLMDKVTTDGNYFLWALKFKYARVRPYIVEPRIHDLEESRASSYPSGHVTYAYIYAYIYQELAPEFSDYFLAKAYMMSHARQIIGVHYPSDCEGSRIFARQFVDRLFTNEKFRRDFEQVKKEWAAKRQESVNSISGTPGK
jgi:acid phosphatase (class A)